MEVRLIIDVRYEKENYVVCLQFYEVFWELGVLFKMLRNFEGFTDNL